MSTWEGRGHERWEHSAGAYVLGALSEDESAAFEAHIEECPVCRAEVEELLPAVQALPAAVEPVEPPAALGERLMAGVRREADVLAAAGPAADGPGRTRGAGRRPWILGRLPALAGAAAALAVGVVAGVLAASGGPETRTVALTAAPPVSGAHVRLVFSDGQATLTADHLPQPPGRRVYQVWLRTSGGAVQPTAALFVPRADGSAIVALPPEVHDSREVMVSAEPRGGSPAPTRPPVLTARL